MHVIQFFADKNCSETVAPLEIGYGPVGAGLFQVEMILVDIGNGKDAWCGSLQNLSDGEKHYFKSWSELVANLQNILTPFAQLEVLKALLPPEETTDPRSDALGSRVNEVPSDSDPPWEEEIMDQAASDFYQRRPELTALSLLSQNASDYFQRHPELIAPAEASLDTTDYYFRHLELQGLSIQNGDLTDYFFRHAGN